MTNPLVAKATAEIYLTKLFEAADLSGGYSEELGRHVLNNVREGHDGYPVIKVVGKNRLVMEFDLDVKPFSEAKVENEAAPRDLLADAHTPGPESPAHSDGYPLPGEEDAAGESDDPEGHAETYGETAPGDVVNNPWAEAEPDPTALAEVDEDNLPEPPADPSVREAMGDGYNSWMDKGDEVKAKTGKGAAGN